MLNVTTIIYIHIDQFLKKNGPIIPNTDNLHHIVTL